MKKNNILLLTSVLLTLSFSSCTQKTIKTEEKDFIKKFYLSKDTAKGALSVDLEIELPVSFHNKAVLDSIRSTIIANLFGKEYIHHHNDSIVGLFASELSREYIENNAPLLNQLDSGSVYSFNNEHNVEGFALLTDENIFTYGIDRNVYMGGAHNLETRNYYNFDLKTGKLITEKDIFVNNYQSALTKLIKRRIIEESEDINSMEELDESVFWTDSIKPNGNFYITDESINYVFNPYEIAPYAYGDTEVTLPFSYIKNLLKPNSVINYLVNKQVK
jgi:Protein of unknown function (DUF3298)